MPQSTAQPPPAWAVACQAVMMSCTGSGETRHMASCTAWPRSVRGMAGEAQRAPQAFGLGHQQAGCLARTRHGAQAGAGKRPVATLRARQGQAQRGPGAALDEQAAQVAKAPGNPVPPEVQAAL